MSAGTLVKAGLVAYSQAAPEVVVRMDLPVARLLQGWLEVTRFNDTQGHMSAPVARLLAQLQALDLAGGTRGGG